MFDVGAEVVNALFWDPAVPDSVIATVDNGWVTLRGEVQRPYQRSRAEADVVHIPGVVGVRNKIVLRDAERATGRALNS